jgi:hypothetical protein
LFASGSTSASCVGTITNITWSTGSGASNGTSFGSSNGIGYFQNTNPNFPLTSGVILSTGNALNAPGPNADFFLTPNAQSEGIDAWLGDADLFNYISGLGIDAGLIDYNNATILEFDFTPLTTTMSFDFLFASEEYGFWQCAYSDAFAFFLTNVTAGSGATNLALIPSTTTPISVVTIRNNAHNAGCTSANPTFFGNFNGGAAAATSATNFNGETVLMTANSTVIPNNLYHIKLVVADRNDNTFDSAVFLGGGSFDIGTADIVGTGEFNGSTDFTLANGTAVCASKTIVAQAGAAQIPGAIYSWTLNGNPILGANANVYTISQAGIYGVTITYIGGCQQTDSMIVEYVPSLAIGVPNDLALCTGPFNLTVNTSIILNGLTNSISYHHTLFDAQQLASPILNSSNYNGIDGEIIYVAIEDDVTGCITTTQFLLDINLNLCATNPIPTTPPNLSLCENAFGSGTATFNFTPQSPIVYGAYNPADFTVSYYTSQVSANTGLGAISNINSSTYLHKKHLYLQ